MLEESVVQYFNAALFVASALVLTLTPAPAPVSTPSPFANI